MAVLHSHTQTHQAACLAILSPMNCPVGLDVTFTHKAQTNTDINTQSLIHPDPLVSTQCGAEVWT